MRCSGLTGSKVIALVFAAAVGLSSGAAALPAAGQGGIGASIQPLSTPASHEHKQWYWHDGWWRYGPWSDHGIYGTVVTRHGPTGLFRPWGAERLRRCAARYSSFDPATGTYLTRRGKHRICR